VIFFMAWFLIIGLFHVDYFARWSEEEEIQFHNVTKDQSMTSLDGNDKHLLQIIKTPEFWMIAFIFGATVGSGVTTVNNLRNIVLALQDIPITDPPQQITSEEVAHFNTISLLVILLSVFNTFGSMGTGLVVDKFQKRVNKETLLFILTVTMTGVQLYVAFASLTMMYAGVVVLGFTIGGTFCAIPVLVSEIFGVKYFGGNWGAVLLAPAIGSLIFSTGVAGAISDAHLRNGNILCVITNGKCAKTCLGIGCYQDAYFIMAGVCALAIITNAVLIVVMSRKKISTF